MDISLAHFQKLKELLQSKSIKAAYDLVHWLSDNFENIIIVSGNHDSRSSKVLARSGFEKEATQVFRPDLLSRIANGEELDDLGISLQKETLPTSIINLWILGMSG